MSLKRSQTVAVRYCLITGLLLVAILSSLIVRKAHKPPYQFLREGLLHDDAVTFGYATERRLEFYRHAYESRHEFWYSFPADFNELCNKASEELLAIGFKQTSVSARPFEAIRFGNRVSKKLFLNVEIVGGVRYFSPGKSAGGVPVVARGADANWVGVNISHGATDYDIWHRIKTFVSR